MTAITFGPNVVVGEAPDERATRYCFGCRKHLQHRWLLLDHTRVSPHDPTPILACSGCDREETTFPGMYYEGPRHWPTDEIMQQLLTDPRYGAHQMTVTAHEEAHAHG